MGMRGCVACMACMRLEGMRTRIGTREGSVGTHLPESSSVERIQLNQCFLCRRGVLCLPGLAGAGVRKAK
jgi:hypothetical protein